MRTEAAKQQGSPLAANRGGMRRRMRLRRRIPTPPPDCAPCMPELRLAGQSALVNMPELSLAGQK
jgi:hypothetical protein